MNLQTDITEVRGQISEQYPELEIDANITDDEIAGWFYRAETQAVQDLNLSGLADCSLGAIQTADLTAGDGSKALPVDLIKVESVWLNGYASGQDPKRCNLISFQDLPLVDRDPIWRATSSAPIASVFGGNVYFRPKATATVTSGLLVNYVKTPTRRYRRYRGSVTTKTSNDVFADSKILSFTFPDDFFNACELRMTSGASRGQALIVADYTAATGTFDMTGTTGFHLVTAGDEFEVGTLSDVPDRFRNIVMEYVIYLALMKDRDDLAGARLVEYKRMVDVINARASGLEVVAR